MATKTKSTVKEGYARYYVYVPIGAGQLALEKTRELSGLMLRRAQDGVARVVKTYDDLGTRGERIVSSIRRSTPTRRAAEQVKSARSRVRAAATSVGKAVDATADATRSAARKVG